MDDCLSELDKIEFTMYQKMDQKLNLKKDSEWFNSLPSVLESDNEKLEVLYSSKTEDFFKAFAQPLQGVCNIPKKIGGTCILS